MNLNLPFDPKKGLQPEEPVQKLRTTRNVGTLPTAPGAPGPLQLSLEQQVLIGTGKERFPGELRERLDLGLQQETVSREFTRRLQPSTTPAGLTLIKGAAAGALGLATRAFTISPVDLFDKSISQLITADVEEASREQAASILEVHAEITAVTANLVWRGLVLDALGTLEGRGIRSVADVFRLVGAPLVEAPADIAWLEGLIGRVRTADPLTLAVSEEIRETVEAREQSAVQKRKDRINQLAKVRSVSTYGMAAASGASLSSIIKRIRVPQLEPGDTLEDFRTVLREADLEESVINELMTEAEVSDIAIIHDNWENYKSKQLLIHQDLLGQDPEDLAELIRKGQLDAILRKGAIGMAILEPLKYYERLIEKYIAAPAMPLWLQLTGANPIARAMQDLFNPMWRLPTTQTAKERQKLYAEWNLAYGQQRASGAGWWEALDFARINSNMAGWEKIAQVVLLDPLTYFGWGLFGKALKPLPRIGPALGGTLEGLELKFAATIDRAFLALARPVGVLAVKTVKQLVTAEVREAISTIQALIGRLEGKSPMTVNPASIRKILTDGFEGVIENPSWSGPQADVGRFLLHRAPLREDEIIKFAELARPGIGRGFLSQDGIQVMIDDVFQHTVGLGGKTMMPEEAAKLLGVRLQIIPTLEELAKIKNAILAYQAGIKRVAYTIIGQDSYPLIIKALGENLIQVITATKQSKLAAARARQGSLGAYLKWAVPETLLAVQVRLDVVSRMVSRQYLIFTAYGFGNVLESTMKSWLAGVKVPWGSLQAPVGSANWVNMLVAEHNKFSVGMLGQPEKFLYMTPSPLTIALAHDATTLRNPTRLSANKLRRNWQQTSRDFAKKLNPLADFGFLQQTFIRSPGRIGLALEANYLTQQYFRAVEALAPRVMTRVRNLINEEMRLDPGLKQALSEDALEDLSKEMYKRAMTGEVPLISDISDDFHMGVIDSKKVNDILVKGQSISPDVYDMLADAGTRGPMWANIDRVFAEADALAKIEIINAPQLMEQRFKELIDETLQHPPVTPEDMVHRFKILTGLVEEYQSSLGIQYHEVNTMLTELPETISKKAFLDVNWDAQMGPLMDTAEDMANQLIDQLRPLIEGDNQFSVMQGFFTPGFGSYLDAHQEVFRVIRAVRTEQAANENAIIAKFGGGVRKNDPRFDEFLNEMLQARTTAWGRGLPDIHEAWAGIEMMAEQISGGQIANRGLLAGGKPTPLSIAALYSSHPHDLVRGIYSPERGLWKTKAEFTARIMAKVRQVADAQGGSVLDTGFTAEAIGDVYDQLVSYIGKQPIFAELASIKSEMIKYGQQRGALMSPEAHNLIAESADRIINRVKADPIASAIFMDEPEVVELITKIDHINASEVGPRYRSAGEASLKPKNAMTEDAFNDLEVSGVPTFGEEESVAAAKELGFDGIRLNSGIEQGFDAIESSVDHLSLRFSEEAIMTTVNDVADNAFEAIRVTGGDELVVLNGLLDEAMEILPKADVEDIAFARLSLEGVSFVRLPSGTLHAVREVPAQQADIVTREFITELEWNAFQREQLTFNTLLGHWISFAQPTGTDAPLREIIASIVKLPSLAGYRQRVDEVLRQIYGDSVTVFRGTPKAHLRLGTEDVEALSASTKPRTGLSFGRDEFTDAGKINIEDVLAIGNVGENELIVPAEKFVPWTEVTGQTTRKGVSWRHDVRQPAYNKAKDAYALDFPGYDNETIANSVARTIFPFWSYEAHRWPWLAREALRHPGNLVNWGRYMDNTDNGYVALPSNAPFGLADLQFNLLRGTIAMGGMRRMLMQDFPEYYDNFPGVANAFDWFSRFGFYPNIWIAGAMATIGPRRGPMQLGELLPPILQTPLDIYLAANSGSGIAQRLNGQIFNNRYRDYNTSQYVSAAGGNGGEINTKIRLEVPLTQEEELAWARGTRSTAQLSLFMTQLPLFRLRPRERVQFQKDAERLIAEITGISVATQREMRKAGMWLEDYMPMHPQHAELLRQLDGWTRWGGLTTHLRETMTGLAQGTWRRFWLDYSEKREGNQVKQREWDIRLANNWLGVTDPKGQVDIGVWGYQRKAIGVDNRKFFESLRASSRYSWKNPVTGKVEPVPVTIEERMTAAATLGYDAPIMHAIEEAQGILFSRDIEDFTGPDPDTGILRASWEDFFDWQDEVMATLQPDLRGELEAWVSRNTSTAQKLRKADWKLWIIPYKAIRNVAIEEFEEDEQKLIKEFNQTRDTGEIQRLRKVERADGTKLISTYSTTLTRMKTNVRKVDPELEARLALWGEVTSFQTEEAERRFEELKIQYARFILEG